MTDATIRRDLQKLEDHNLLQPLHGGAIPVGGNDTARFSMTDDEHEVRFEEALILALVQKTASHTLREKTLRNQIPFLAESCPQESANTTTELRLNFSVQAAAHTNLIEEEPQQLTLHDDTLSVTLGHQAIETFKLFPQ